MGAVLLQPAEEDAEAIDDFIYDKLIPLMKEYNIKSIIFPSVSRWMSVIEYKRGIPEKTENSSFESFKKLFLDGSVQIKETPKETKVEPKETKKKETVDLL